jgi:2-oxoglutarate dehydrogenase E1 component
LREIFSAYSDAQRVFWVQEEPRNMGAWTFVRDRLSDLMAVDIRLEYAGREASASTATGSMRVHRSEQATLVADAFEDLE